MNNGDDCFAIADDDDDDDANAVSRGNGSYSNSAVLDNSLTLDRNRQYVAARVKSWAYSRTVSCCQS